MSARGGATRPWWARPVGPVVVVLVLGAIITARASFTVHGERTFTLFDDAMVSMRYARNLAEGHGLVYNVGATPVEGFTNPLWTLWMTLLHLVPVPRRIVPALVSASGVVLVAIAVGLTGAVARRLDPLSAVVPAVAMWATAVWYPLLFWSVRGLEPGLVSVCVLGAALLALRVDAGSGTRDAVALGAVLAVGVLTRLDFVVPAVAMLGWLGRRRGPARRVALGVAGSTLAVTVALLLAQRAYYGDALPNTYTLKLTGVSVVTRLGRGGSALWDLFLAELAVPVALAVVGWCRRPRPAGLWLLGLVFLGGCAYSVWVGGDAWEYTQYANRYVAPLVPLLVVMAALGVRALAALPSGRRELAVAAVGVIAVASTVGANALGTDGEQNLRTLYNLQPLRDARWIALVAGLVLLGAAVVSASRLARNALLVAASVGVALVVLMALPAWLEWRRSGGDLVSRNGYEARLGLAVRAAARGRPSVAVVAAGNIPYWSALPTVDLLGKSDPVIAREPPRSKGFDPGHSKWDYRYSVCRLRPALVLQLFAPSSRDLQAIRACGFRQIIGNVFERSGERGFDPERLREAVFLTR